jgi:hypothetical protein
MTATMMALAVVLGGPVQEPAPAPTPPVVETAKGAKAYGLPLEGEAAEAFLKTAQVVEHKAIGAGITDSERLTLADGTRTCHAARKTIDEFRRGMMQLKDGRSEMDFRDSWKSEVAAYELDKLLGLGLVPPTVERTIGGHAGSLQLWVEGAIDEPERLKRKLEAPDPERWNQQIYAMRLLRQLTFDTDYGNVTNVLIDPDFRAYAIDFTRAFRTQGSLMSEKGLVRFSRSVLDRLVKLDEATLKEKLGHWLDRYQIDGLLKRRDKILALAKKLVSEKGEPAVYYP